VVSTQSELGQGDAVLWLRSSARVASVISLVLLLAAGEIWLASYHWLPSVRYDSAEPETVTCSRGQLLIDQPYPGQIFRSAPPTHRAGYIDHYPFAQSTRDAAARGVRRTRLVTLPLWPLLAALAVLPVSRGALVLLRRACRRESNSCACCGYDLTGLPAEHRCPECGTPYPWLNRPRRSGALIAWAAVAISAWLVAVSWQVWITPKPQVDLPGLPVAGLAPRLPWLPNLSGPLPVRMSTDGKLIIGSTQRRSIDPRQFAKPGKWAPADRVGP